VNEAQAQFLNDLVVTALEGGSNYWAEFKGVTLEENGYVLPFHVRPQGDDGVGEWVLVTQEKLHDAVCRVLDGRAAPVGRDIRAQFVGYPHDLDSTNMDAEGADVVLQVLTMGAIVFG
jgi:hypothetical protein